MEEKLLKLTMEESIKKLGASKDVISELEVLRHNAHAVLEEYEWHLADMIEAAHAKCEVDENFDFDAKFSESLLSEAQEAMDYFSSFTFDKEAE